MSFPRLGPTLLVLSASCASAPPPPPVPVAPPPVPIAAPTPPPAPTADGSWLGAITVSGVTLHLQLRVGPSAGKDGCALDSLDQGSFGIACHFASAAGGALTVEVPEVQGDWSGVLSVDGDTLAGAWTQGDVHTPLALKRQATSIEAPKGALDAALPPVDVKGLESVLEADLQGARANGELAPATGTGVTVGVIEHGVRRIFSYGVAKPDSLFEIGSITKTFTSLLLAQLAQEAKVQLEEPVRALLPKGTLAKPDGAEIRLVDLADQHSGLPRMPDNFQPVDPKNPYADYDEKALYAWLGKQGVALPANAPFGYSNVGVGLLGHALAHRAGVGYDALLRQQITGPLGMNDTVLVVPPAKRARFLEGHDAAHRPTRAWDFATLAGAGGVRSTASDMLTYLEAQLHPEHLPAAATGPAKTLPAAIAETHGIRGDASPGEEIALAWFRKPRTGTYWHSGVTGGYSAMALFNPKKDFAIVVLSNAAPGPTDFTDKLARHIAQRLQGVPAVGMGPAGP